MAVKGVPLIVAVWVFVPCPEAENVPVCMALMAARPETFTGRTMKSLRQSGAAVENPWDRLPIYFGTRAGAADR